MKKGLLIVLSLSFFISLIYYSHAGGHKIAVCHIDSNPNHHSIIIDENALEDHLKHGDYLGVCEEDILKTREFGAFNHLFNIN